MLAVMSWIPARCAQSTCFATRRERAMSHGSSHAFPLADPSALSQLCPPPTRPGLSRHACALSLADPRGASPSAAGRYCSRGAKRSEEP
eukprot:1629909-Rhodomonas_salina.1